MPMNPSGLSAEINALFVAAFGPPEDPAILQAFCDAIATAVVAHIVANATVVGVTPGPGTATIT